MNAKTPLLLSAAVLLSLGALYLINREPAPKAPGEGKDPKPLFDPTPTDIVTFELVAWGKPGLKFQKAGEKWRMVEPFSARADKFQVDAELSRITGLQVLQAYDKGDKNRPSDDMTKFNQPNWVAKITNKAGKTTTVRIGQTALLEPKSYVQVDGDDKTYKVRGDLNAEIKGDLDQMRDKRVLDFSTTDSQKVIVTGTPSYTLAKAGTTWMLEQPVRARADASAVNTLLSSLSSAYAKKFVDNSPRSLARYGLDKPRLSVTVETEKKTVRPPPAGSTQPATQPEFDIERQAVSILFGASVEGSVYARLGDEGSPSVFEMPDTVLTSIALDLNKLRDKSVVSVDTVRANKITLSGPAGAVELDKKDGLWLVGAGPDAPRAEFAAVDDILKALRDLKASDFESSDALQPDYGFDANATTLELTSEGAPDPVKLTLGNTTPAGTGVYLRNDRDNSVAVVKAEGIAALRVGPMAFVERKLLSINKDHVTELTFDSEGLTRELGKTFGMWKLAQPVEALADSKAVTDLLTDLGNLDARTIVGTQNDLAKFGLDAPQVKLKVTVQPPPVATPGSQPATGPASTQPAPPVMVPQPAQHHTVVASRSNGKAYVFVEGGDKIGEVDDKIFRDMTAEMHDTAVVKFDTSTLTGVELRIGDRKLSFAKRGEQWSLEGEPGFKGDAAKVKAVADAIKDLKTDKFMAYMTEDFAKYKLDAPAIIAIARNEESAAELRISSEGPAGDESKRRFAMIGGTTKVFLISPAEVAKFDKQIKDFESGGPAAAPGMPPQMPPQMPPGMDGDE